MEAQVTLEQEPLEDDGSCRCKTKGRSYYDGPYFFAAERLQEGDPYGGQRDYFWERCNTCDGTRGRKYIQLGTGPFTDYDGAFWSVRHQTFVFPNGAAHGYLYK